MEITAAVVKELREKTGVGMMGLYGGLAEHSPRVPWQGAISHGHLSAVQETIGGGTSEDQREIIALRRLGLPRG